MSPTRSPRRCRPKVGGLPPGRIERRAAARDDRRGEGRQRLRFRFPIMTATDLATKARAPADSAARRRSRRSPPSTRSSARPSAGSCRPSSAPTRASGRTRAGSRTMSSRRLAELGYIGLKFPAEYGGDDDPVADAVFVEELAWCGSGGVAAGIGAHGGIAMPPIWKFGTEDQKQRYLVPGIRGETIGALAITEPDAGSDVASIRTHAPPGRRWLRRQRVKDCSSPAACAPTSSSPRSRRRRRVATAACRS